MPSNIEKLCEEINALAEEDPQSFQCAISTKPGEQRIYLDFCMEPIVTGYIDFEKITPYDPTGAPGTTDDVYAGASLHVTIHDHEGASPGECDRLRGIYPLNIYFDMNDAARAGKISSKILAEWPITREQRQQRAQRYKQAIKDSKKSLEEFLAEQDPVTAAALKKAWLEARVANRTKKNVGRKRRK